MHSEQTERAVPDLWGRVMHDYHTGRPAVYAIRRDDGHLTEGHSPEVYFSDPADFFPWESGPLEAAQGPVLDIGSGPGRMALWAQQRGFEVVAVEASPLTARVAQERGVVDVRQGHWEALRDVLSAEESAFGTALLMGHNLGLGGTLKGLRELLGVLRRRTRPAATLLATSIAFGATEDPVHSRYQDARRREGRYPGELRIRVEYARQVGPYFPWLLVEPNDLGSVARQTGWFLEQLVMPEGVHYGAVLRRVP